MKYDYLIVGAGFAGCVLAERLANELDKKVLIVEKRNHIGGNCYDFADENGILVHKYGPHIFHTKETKVWRYISSFSDFVPYYHKVLAVIDGIKIPAPFNFNALYKLFPQKQAEKIEAMLLENYKYGTKLPILSLLENAPNELRDLAEIIYEKLFLQYTIKQWGLSPKELDPSVTARIPIFLSRDDRYFQDPYQGIPKNGYTKIFEKMIKSKNIHLLLNADYKDVADEIHFDKMIYTGMIDQFFDYEFGALPYRSINLDFQTIDTDYFQEVAQVNYPNEFDFTRITEFKHFLREKSDKTTIAYEYPQEYVNGVNDPYYPIPRAVNEAKRAQYEKCAEKCKDSVYFIGRLADYKYYNMDQTILAALNLFEKLSEL